MGESEAGSQAAIVFFSANGETKPKASFLIPWPSKEDEMVLKLMEFAQMSPPPLTPRSADLLCRSLFEQRVYCLVLIDPPDSSVKRGMEELQESKVEFMKEVEQIRESEGYVTEEEDNFVVPGVRLFRRARWLQPSIKDCRAPKFSQIEQVLNGSSALLLDLDTNRIAALKGITSYRGIYPQIAYEESLTWVDDAFHPFLSLPDCDEGVLPNFTRTTRSSTMLELLMKLLTVVLLLEALAKAATERSVKWACGAGVLVIVMLLRSPPFVRSVASYLPGAIFSPALLLKD